MKGKHKELGHIYFAPITLSTWILTTTCLMYVCEIKIKNYGSLAIYHLF